MDKTRFGRIDVYYKEIEGTTWMRLLEMTVESRTTKINDLQLVGQFFRDIKVFGLREAIIYVEGYEEDGDYEVGTAAKLKEIMNDIVVKFKQPMEIKDKYVLDEYDLDEIANRFYKIEGLLTGDIKMITAAYVRDIADLMQVPFEVACVWADDYWVKEVVDDEVKDMAVELSRQGKVVIEI